MRKITRTLFEEEDDDMVRETLLILYMWKEYMKVKDS